MSSLISVRPELRAYQEAGVFALADVHTAVHVGRLAGESDERALLGLALAVRALRHGSVCVELGRLADAFAELEGEEREEGGAGSVVADLPWPDTQELVATLRESPLHRRRLGRTEAVDAGRYIVGCAAVSGPLLPTGTGHPTHAHRA